MPEKIYSRLEKEYHANPRVFTVGGHTNREMIYTFANYRNAALLNVMDAPRQMQMNCDFYYALKIEEPYYRFFYDEIEDDPRWGRVLLRRKQNIERHTLKHLNRGGLRFSGNGEFYEFLRFDSTALRSKNCLEAEVALTFNQVPKPFKAFVVLSINGPNNEPLQYKPAILYWLSPDLNGKTRRMKLVTGALPSGYKDVVVYLWNIDKKEVDVHLDELKIHELNAPGINVSIPPSFYTFISKFNQLPQL